MSDMKTIATAGFRAGWTAACLTIAAAADHDGDRESGDYFRQMANRPPPVQVGDLSTPEGQAMRAGSEIVMHERIARGGDDASREGTP